MCARLGRGNDLREGRDDRLQANRCSRAIPKNVRKLARRSGSSIPCTKAVHMLASPASVLVRDERAGKRLPLLPSGAGAEEVGYGRIADLSWQHLLSLDACTKCGKCHAACPATAAGYPLSPRDLVLDLRVVA